MKMMRIMKNYSSCVLMVMFYYLIMSLISTILLGGGGGVVGQEIICGKEGRHALCEHGLCCSIWGHCGNTSAFCDPENCQSQCHDPINPPPPPPPPPPPSPSTPLPPPPFSPTPAPSPSTGEGDLTSIISQSIFDNKLFPHRNHPVYDGNFYTYDAFMKAAMSFPGFATTGDIDTRKRELAAFLAQTAHETTDLVAQNTIISIFQTAFWFWMTPQSPKPSCHEVMTGQWEPTEADIAAGRLPGYGLTTNIIKGGIECGLGENDYVKNRIRFYQRFCEILGVSPGDHLDCYSQKPFNWGIPQYNVASMKK